MDPSTSTQRNGASGPSRPVVVGEVLYDVFPDGREILGGAPFNVAWNLRGLGSDPLLITRVGRDARGERILQAMERWGLDRAGVQRDGERPTGIVRVTIEDDAPAYEIVPGQAWDALDGGAAIATARATTAGVLYRGTLAARSRTNRRALADLREAVAAPVFVDVNLRSPWWVVDGVRAVLDAASVVKLNEDELAALAPAGPERSLARSARELRERHGIDTLVVTRGADGAAWFDEAGAHRADAPRPEPFVDAVGAGDAFAAVTLVGRAGGLDPTTVLQRATAFAAVVCGLRGATTDDPEPYRRTLRAWAGGEGG